MLSNIIIIIVTNLILSTAACCLGLPPHLWQPIPPLLQQDNVGVNSLDVDPLDRCLLFIQKPFETIGAAGVYVNPYGPIPFALLSVSVQAERASSGEVNFNISFIRSDDIDVGHIIKRNPNPSPATTISGTCFNNTIKTSPMTCPANYWEPANATINIGNCSCVNNVNNNDNNSNDNQIVDNGKNTCMAFDLKSCSPAGSFGMCDVVSDSNCAHVDIVMSIACDDGDGGVFNGVLRTSRAAAAKL